jgi:hypothetical protein
MHSRIISPSECSHLFKRCRLEFGYNLFQVIVCSKWACCDVFLNMVKIRGNRLNYAWNLVAKEYAQIQSIALPEWCEPDIKLCRQTRPDAISVKDAATRFLLFSRMHFPSDQYQCPALPQHASGSKPIDLSKNFWRWVLKITKLGKCDFQCRSVAFIATIKLLS